MNIQIDNSIPKSEQCGQLDTSYDLIYDCKSRTKPLLSTHFHLQEIIKRVPTKAVIGNVGYSSCESYDILEEMWRIFYSIKP